MKKSLPVFSICAVLFAFTLFMPFTPSISAQTSANTNFTVDALPWDIDFWSDYPSDILADTLVSRMEDSELLSQIFMFGWAGAEPSELLNQWVSDRGLGSVKVFGWNTDDIHLVAKSISALQKKSQNRPYKIPLFVATDQEGGWIRHVKGETLITPGNMAIGASGYPIDAWYSGYYINKEIHALGINMNFAPSVDLFTNQNSSIIGTRSFCDDADNAGVLGAAFSAGSIAAGVIPTAKHFPGHGATNEDSHIFLPTLDIDYETWEKRELVPFKYLITEKIPAIMSGHLSFPQITHNQEPASLSKTFLTEILRNQLGYEGLIITDDMMMNGDTLYAGSLSNAYKMAIEAGNDIIISSTTARLNEALWTTNLNKMKTDEEFKSIVKKAARRVIKCKLDYFKNPGAAPLYPNPQTLSQFIPDKDGQKFFLEQACRSISFQKRGELFPYKPDSSEKILICGPFTSLFNEGKKRYPSADTFYFSYKLRDDMENFGMWNADGLEWTARRYDTIIILVYDKHTANIARRLRNSGKHIIILSVLSPVFVLEDFDFADTILCGYSYSDYSFAALFGALHGEFSVRGTIPLLR